MKIAVAGKGGTGKTFISGTLSRLLAQDGFRVLAIDSDPAMNLAYALGIPQDVVSEIVPIAENKDLIEERTGNKSDSPFSVFINLAPTVYDIADKYGVVGPDGVRLLVMGTVLSGGSGCMCPVNSLVRALIRHVTLVEKDVVVMDMEAGLEHLGRATARGFDALLCVVDPGAQSLETAARIKRLSHDIHIKQVIAVGNKVIRQEDEEIIRDSLSRVGLDIMGTVPFDRNIIQSDISRVAPIDYCPSTPAINAVRRLEGMLKERFGQESKD